jgi:hypothetical protein
VAAAAGSRPEPAKRDATRLPEAGVDFYTEVGASERERDLDERIARELRSCLAGLAEEPPPPPLFDALALRKAAKTIRPSSRRFRPMGGGAESPKTRA